MSAGDGVAGVRATVLRTQDDRPFRLGELLGHTVVLNFVYTGCGSTCPVQTDSLAAVQARLPAGTRGKVVFVSISVDPEHDAPGSLRAFAEAHGADLSNWVFLTGTPDRVRRVGAFLGAASPAPGRDPVRDHLTTIHLFDAHGDGLMHYAGVPVDEARLLADIETVATPL